MQFNEESRKKNSDLNIFSLKKINLTQQIQRQWLCHCIFFLTRSHISFLTQYFLFFTIQFFCNINLSTTGLEFLTTRSSLSLDSTSFRYCLMNEPSYLISSKKWLSYSFFCIFSCSFIFDWLIEEAERVLFCCSSELWLFMMFRFIRRLKVWFASSKDLNLHCLSLSKAGEVSRVVWLSFLGSRLAPRVDKRSSCCWVFFSMYLFMISLQFPWN